MFKKVDPTNKVLVSYLQSIETTVVTGKLQQEATKKTKKSKKTKGDSSEKGLKDDQHQALIGPSSTVEKVSPILTSVADTPVIEASTSKETIPSKTGVFRRIKIKRKSQLVKKTQVTHQGVTVREVTAPVSPSSKKRRAEEMAKFLKKPKLVEDEELVPETPEADIPKEVEIFQSTEISKPADVKILESTTLPQATSTIDSPTFQSIMNQPFTTIFSTQSTEPPQSLSPIPETMAIDEETDNEGFGGTFEDLSFDKSEEDFPDHVGNDGINLLQVDSLMKEMENRLLSKNSGLIRDSKSRILEKIDQSDSSTENRIKFLRTDFLKEVKDLKMVTKERHVLFVQEVKKVREDVNMQIRELREEMTKEVQTLNQGYDSAHQKIDIICDAIVQCVKSLLTSISDAPPAITGVQGGEKSVQEKAGEHEMKPEDSKAPVKPTIVSAAPVISTVTTTVPISRPSTKVIVIGNVVSSNVSSSKGAAPSNEKHKGKGVLIEKTNKEKKAEVAAELEGMRHVESIMRQRALEGSNVNKGEC
ncbi:unnamed protein product [Lactuca saligna]|uniref:Uncharacterized protein n=1 Tax=Lactuca saligna TaxID=75948 RepID=A0AA35V2Y8_LACSI|nr:unnamed protein product [Lactuca saligna]